MSQQQTTPYIAKYRGSEAQKQRDEQVKAHIAQVKNELGDK